MSFAQGCLRRLDVFTDGAFSRKAKRSADPGHRTLRFEAMEERALLSVSGQCSYQHVLLEPATYPQPQGESPAESPMLTSSLTPAQIRGAYGIDKIKLGSIVGDGTGQTIAIVDAYDNPSFVSSTSSSFSTSDLAVFDDYFGLPDPPSFLKLNQTGGTSYPTGDTGWGQEIALDVEWAHAVAPGANIILFEANSNSTSDLMAAVNTARNYPGVSVISLSWGSTDYGSGYLYDSYFTTPSGHTGVTFLASSGDDGKPGIYPAYSPNVVAVGGTSLTVSGTTYASETAWSGSGGGQSSYESEPTYQNAFQSSGKRQMPDVSFDADPNSGVKFYDTYGFSGWGNIGGTSLSAPCWAGLVAIANQLRAEAGLGTLDANGSPTQVHTLLYGFAGSSSSYNTLGYYHDITSGSNGYSAAAGYDLVTGLGSPVANKLVPSLVTVTSKGSVGFSASTYAPSETPLVTILDLDRSSLSTATVEITTSTGDDELISLSALGGGIFQGAIPTAPGAAVTGDGTVQVGTGATVTATYHDANDGTGHTATPTATASVAAPLAITSTTLPTAIAMQSYSVSLAAAGGVPAYTWSSTMPDYTETNPGTSWLGGGTAMGWKADDAYWTLSLPWAFSYYGNKYNSVYVCSNGFLNFTAMPSHSASNSDAALESNACIAPLWDDLDTSSYSSDDIYVTSTSYFVGIRWAAHVWNTSHVVNFEVVLFANGDIRFDYGTGDSGGALTNLTPTVGISKGDSTHYTLSTYDSDTSIAANTSTLMRSPPPGLSLSSSGVLSGTPTTAGTFTFPVTVTDSGAPQNTKTKTMQLTVAQDGLAIAATSAAKSEGSSGTTPFTFTVTRTGLTTGATTVQYAVTGSGTNPADAADFGGTLPSGTVTFAAGETSQTITINVSGDTLVEPDESFVVTLSGASSDAIITTASAPGTIRNDDVASITGRYVFYNNSYYDGYTTAANTLDDSAIATDKSALLPGLKASFANYTSYSRGINGVMVDIVGVAGPITASDFQFKVGNVNDPSSWTAAPTPGVTWRTLPNGSIRVTLIWADNAIQKQWLQVKVLATADTALSSPDVFYFGNAIGESGDSTANAWVNATDAVAVGSHVQVSPRVDVTNRYDYNRDGRVNATDAVLVGSNVVIGPSALQLITPVDNQRYMQLLTAALSDAAATSLDGDSKTLLGSAVGVDAVFEELGQAL